ncbi:MAG TPA: fumarylacetoacetate hydrolase family protein [Vicinamibacterales bacterium]|jgi:2-keto-4-pentenoate hydratase/2-oxohepta-3-ene-1,7-dioic acid hydratase in catechol pathway
MERIYRIEYHGSKRYAAEHNGRLFLLDGDLFGEYGFGEEIAHGEFPRDLPAGSRLLAPITPSKIVAIGLNYKDHAAEQKKPLPAEPMLFIKPSTAVIGPGDPIKLPGGIGRIDYESEVAVVIGKRASRVTREHALEYVLGYTCANDVTARNLQNRGYQYSHVKGYDTFAPIGPSIAVGLDPTTIAVQGWQNGQMKQNSTTAQLIFPVADLIVYVSAIMTLLPGDLISTGTPSGIGPLAPGDVFTVRVSGIGELTNPVENL